MDRRSQNAFLLGLAALTGVVLLLLTSPDLLFSSGVTFIDTELHRSSGDEAYVVAKMDFGSREHMTAFPQEIGKWTGHEYDTTEYVELLGADVIVLRRYEPKTFSQPVFFLIMQADTESSFHPPNICYRAQGFEVQEEGNESVVVADAGWARETSTSTVPLAKLVVVKRSEEGEITERRLALFNYVKGNQFTTDTVTMLQVEALAPLDGSYDGSLNEMKAFFAEAIPLMFEPGGEDGWRPIAVVLVELGIPGYLVIAFLLLIPVAIIALPRIRWRPGATDSSTPGE